MFSCAGLSLCHIRIAYRYVKYIIAGASRLYVVKFN
jgi:hypothetical protein